MAKAYPNDGDDLAQDLNELSITEKNSSIKKEDPLTIMNINYGEFTNSKDKLLNVIKYYEPDIITLQETIITFTENIITAGGKNYKYEKCNENEYQKDNTFNAIIYNKNKFNKVNLNDFENKIKEKNKEDYDNGDFSEIRKKKLAIIYLLEVNKENEENSNGLLVASFHNFNKTKGGKDKFKCMSLICKYLNDLKGIIQGKVALIIGTDSNIEMLKHNVVNELKIFGSSEPFKIKVGANEIDRKNLCFFIVDQNIDLNPAEIINYDSLKYMVGYIKSNIDQNFNRIEDLEFKGIFQKLINLIDNEIVFLKVKVTQFRVSGINFTFLNPPAVYQNKIQHPILISNVEIKSTLTDNKKINEEVSKKRTEEEMEKEKEKEDKKDKEAAQAVGGETEKEKLIQEF